MSNSGSEKSDHMEQAECASYQAPISVQRPPGTGVVRHEIAKTSFRIAGKIRKVEKSFKRKNFCVAKNPSEGPIS